MSTEVAPEREVRDISHEWRRTESRDAYAWHNNPRCRRYPTRKYVTADKPPARGRCAFCFMLQVGIDNAKP